MVLNVMLLVPISSFMDFTTDQLSTLSVILTGFTGLLILLRVCTPFNVLRSILFYSMATGFLVAMLFFSEFSRLFPSRPLCC